MSRIGRKPITVPAGVEVTIDGSAVTVKGPKGTLSGTFNKNMTIAKDGDVVTVTRPNDEKENRSLHGLTRTLIANMVEGVSNGYSKTLDIVGIGYRASMQGKDVVLSVGYRPAPVAPKAKHVHVIGDAFKVGNLRTVIWQAWDVAMKL